MKSKKKTAKIAGVWYLLLAVTGGFGTMYVPLNITVAVNPAATVQNIIDSGWIYHLSIVSSLTSGVLFIYLVLALYRLLREVDPKQAKVMVLLVAVSVPITFLNSLNLIAADLLTSGNEYLNAFGKSEQETLALVALNLYDQGVLFEQIFWGLWLLPFGILVYKSNFIPRIFGILLVINCFAYLITTFFRLMELHLTDVITYILVPFIMIGEFAIMLWLLIKGVKQPVNNSVNEKA